MLEALKRVANSTFGEPALELNSPVRKFILFTAPKISEITIYLGTLLTVFGGCAFVCHILAPAEFGTALVAIVLPSGVVLVVFSLLLSEFSFGWWGIISTSRHKPYDVNNDTPYDASNDEPYEDKSQKIIDASNAKIRAAHEFLDRLIETHP
jgi:hypothetical protein